MTPIRTDGIDGIDHGLDEKCLIGVIGVKALEGLEAGGDVGALASFGEQGGEAGVLFFAGEHTDTSGQWGMVHGTLRTGLRVAAQVLAGL
jgi:hypothetical protein